MLDAAQQAADFKRALDNIKSRNIQAVAARMCRVIREFSRTPTSRIRDVEVDGEETEVNLSGTLFDTVWQENIGAKLAHNSALTINRAKMSVDGLYLLKDMLISFGSDILKGSKDPSTVSSELNEIYDELNSMVSSEEFTEESTKTYDQIGFTLNPRTLDELEDRDDFDTYSFGKYLSRTDIITALRVVHGYIDSKEWTESDVAGVNIVRSYADVIETAIVCTLDTIIDISHFIDGIAICENAEELEKPLREFNPEEDESYVKIDSIQSNDWLGAFAVKDEGTYTISIVCEYPYFLSRMTIDSNDIDLPVISSTEGVGGKCVYLSEPLNLGMGENITYRIRALEGHGSYFDRTKFSIFISKEGEELGENPAYAATPSTTYPDIPTNWTGNKFYSRETGEFKFILTLKGTAYNVSRITYKGTSLAFESNTMSGNRVIDTSKFSYDDTSYPVIVDFTGSGTFDSTKLSSVKFYSIPAIYWEGNKYSFQSSTTTKLIWIQTKSGSGYTVDRIKKGSSNLTFYDVGQNTWLAIDRNVSTSGSNVITVDFGPGIAYGEFNPANVSYVKFEDIPITKEFSNAFSNRYSGYTDVTNYTASELTTYFQSLKEKGPFTISLAALLPKLSIPGGDPSKTISLSVDKVLFEHRNIDKTYGDQAKTAVEVNVSSYTSSATFVYAGVTYNLTTNKYKTSYINSSSARGEGLISLKLSTSLSKDTNAPNLSLSVVKSLLTTLGGKVLVRKDVFSGSVNTLPCVVGRSLIPCNATVKVIPDLYSIKMTGDTKKVPTGFVKDKSFDNVNYSGKMYDTFQVVVPWQKKGNIIYSPYNTPDCIVIRVKNTLASKITSIKARMFGEDYSNPDRFLQVSQQVNTSSYVDYVLDFWRNGTWIPSIHDTDRYPVVIDFEGTITAAELNLAKNGTMWWGTSMGSYGPADISKRAVSWFSISSRRYKPYTDVFNPWAASSGVNVMTLFHSYMIGDGYAGSDVAAYINEMKWETKEHDYTKESSSDLHTATVVKPEYATDDVYLCRSLSLPASVGDYINVASTSGIIGGYNPEFTPTTAFRFQEDPVYRNYARQLPTSLPTWRVQPYMLAPNVILSGSRLEPWKLAHIFRIPCPGIYALIKTRDDNNKAVTLTDGAVLKTTTVGPSEMESVTTYADKIKKFKYTMTLDDTNWLYCGNDREAMLLLDLRDTTNGKITYLAFDKINEYWESVRIVRITDEDRMTVV